MRFESKSDSGPRLKDADEFLESAEENITKSRFKASADHSIDACIAANDAFTIKHIGKIATRSHFEALDMHREAGMKFKENKASILRFLINERHRLTYRPIKVNKEMAEELFLRAVEFTKWIKEHLD